MKALWLREVQAFLDQDDFSAWFAELLESDARLVQAVDSLEEMLAQVSLMKYRAEHTQKSAIDTLYRAGEFEDIAAQLLAEVSEIENRAYEAVASFENQRIMVSDVFNRLGALEHRLLTQQSVIGELKRKEKLSDNKEKTVDFLPQIKRRQKDLGDMDRAFREAQSIYERENERKLRLWEEVEQLWSRSMASNLSVAERRAKSRRARRQAERLFEQAEEQKQAAATLGGEAGEARSTLEKLKEKIRKHRQQAKGLCGCLVGEEFLYWPRRESNKEAYCMPLADHPEGYNIDLKAKTLYLIKRQRGVEFIEPLPPESLRADGDDPRIDEFFMGSES